MSDVYAEYRAKYAELTAKVAAIKEEVAPIQAELDEVNAQIEVLRAKQNELVDKKSAAYGGQAYIDLKKHVAALAKLLTGK